MGQGGAATQSAFAAFLAFASCCRPEPLQHPAMIQGLAVLRAPDHALPALMSETRFETPHEASDDTVTQIMH